MTPDPRCTGHGTLACTKKNCDGKGKSEKHEYYGEINDSKEIVRIISLLHMIQLIQFVLILLLLRLLNQTFVKCNNVLAIQESVIGKSTIR